MDRIGNESNNEVREIDENYANRYLPPIDRNMPDFSDMDLDVSHDELLERLKQMLEELKDLLTSKAEQDESIEDIDSPYEDVDAEEEMQDFFQQLPNLSPEAFQELLASAISDLLKQLLEQMRSEMMDQQMGNEQNMSNQFNGEQQSQDGQSSSNQQNQSSQLSSSDIQNAMDSLVQSNNNEQIEKIDEKFDNGSQNNQSSDSQNGEEYNDMLENGDFQGGSNEGQSPNNMPQGEGGKPSKSDIQKTLESLSSNTKPDGNMPSEETGLSNGDQPNLDENAPVTATYSDSDDLTKLNVNWADEDVNRSRTTKNHHESEKQSEDKLLKLFLKYLVKTNYYIKSYGLDKKNKRQIAKHFLLGLEHKIMTDTYSNKTEPLSFYIDMKGQCSELSEYNEFFRKMFDEKGVSIYFGCDGEVSKYIKVKKAGANLDFDNCDMCHFFQNESPLPENTDREHYYEAKILEETVPLEEFVKSHRLTRLVAFADFDASTALVKSSAFSKIWWFSTARTGRDLRGEYSLNQFKGHFIVATNLENLPKFFEHINDPSYEIRQRKLQLSR